MHEPPSFSLDQMTSPLGFVAYTVTLGTSVAVAFAAARNACNDTLFGAVVLAVASVIQLWAMGVLLVRLCHVGQKRELHERRIAAAKRNFHAADGFFAMASLVAVFTIGTCVPKMTRLENASTLTCLATSLIMAARQGDGVVVQAGL